MWQHVQLHPPHPFCSYRKQLCMQHIHLFSSQMYIDFFLCYGLTCSFESRLHACRMKASNPSNSPFHSSDTRKNLGPKNLLPGPLPMSFAWRLRHTQIKKKSGTYPYPCYCQLVRGMLGYHTVGFIKVYTIILNHLDIITEIMMEEIEQHSETNAIPTIILAQQCL